MDVQRIAAFSLGDKDGNPAGIVLLTSTMDEAEMARIANEVGYSETAFALPQNDDHKKWRVRYFSPESEVPFCGHATIALGAALGNHYGAQKYHLVLNDAEITVTAQSSDSGMTATLSSPPTRSQAASTAECQDIMALFNLTPADLDTRLKPARIHGGADHIMLALKERTALANMDYDLDQGREVMHKHQLVTIMLVYIDNERSFSVRNAFASGGVPEDPATGAAAAAFAGYLRDQAWPHGGLFTIRQGEDMGHPSLINVRLSDISGSSVHVTGSARAITT